MVEYLKSGPFSVQMAGDQSYRDNWDAIFAKPKSEATPIEDEILVENYAEGANLEPLEGRTVRAELPDFESVFDEAAYESFVSKYDIVPLNEIEGSIQHDVREFHRVMGQPICAIPGVPSDERVRHRLRLIHEEYTELLTACGIEEPTFEDVGVYSDILAAINSQTLNVDLVEVADALADIAYVVEGFSIEAGIDSEAVLAEVQRSNLSKLDDNGKAVVNELGKVTKGPNYSPPNVADVLRKQGWNG